MEGELKLTLVISGLTVEDAKALAKLISEIAEKDPTRTYACIVRGLEEKSFMDAQKIMREIFPPGGVAS